MEGGRLGASTKESSGAFLSGREGALSAQSSCMKVSIIKGPSHEIKEEKHNKNNTPFELKELFSYESNLCRHEELTWML
jgi:hypothetical protein